MDVDMVKSAAEDQMEMMMMMMHMEKLPQFCRPYSEVSELSSMEFSGGGNGGPPPPIFENQHVAPPPFINPPPPISFMGAPVQEPGEPALLANSLTGRFRSNTAGELSGLSSFSSQSQKRNSMAAMREMIFRIAVMQPIHIDPESVKPPKRRNVKISKDPQSVAARHRRERISERIRILQRLVPGGTKMDTASMLDEAIHYVKFLKTQVQSLERAAANRPTGIGFPVTAFNNTNYTTLGKGYQPAQLFSPTAQMLS